MSHVGGTRHSGLGLGDLASSRDELETAARGPPIGGDPHKTLLTTSDHLAQMSMHATAAFGYQQWFLFDEVWAAANRPLARSLLRYARI